MSATSTSPLSETFVPRDAPDERKPEEARPRTRIESNRENARHSTGPLTAEGKERASQNSLKHGIYSQEVVLPHEDRNAYEALNRALNEHWNAETIEELTLVQVIVGSRWRLRRVLARETALIIVTAEHQRASVEKMFDADPDVMDALAQAAGYKADLRVFAQLNRLEARLERSVDNATRELTAFGAARLRDAAVKAQMESICVSQPPPAATPAATPTASGFVPSLPVKPSLPPNMPVFSGPLKKENRRQWLRKHGYDALAKAA